MRRFVSLLALLVSLFVPYRLFAQVPPAADTYVASSLSSSNKFQFVLIDITTLVRNWVTGQTANDGIALAVTSGSLAVSFDSKEATDTSHPAELEIAIPGATGQQGAAGPAGPTVPQGAQGPTGPTGATGVACVTAGQAPDNPAFSSAGICPVALTPASVSVRNVAATGTFTPSCSDGSDLYVMYTFPANSLTSPLNFSYVSVAVQGSL